MIRQQGALLRVVRAADSRPNAPPATLEFEERSEGRLFIVASGSAEHIHALHSRIVPAVRKLARLADSGSRHFDLRSAQQLLAVRRSVGAVRMDAAVLPQWREFVSYAPSSLSAAAVAVARPL